MLSRAVGAGAASMLVARYRYARRPRRTRRCRRANATTLERDHRRDVPPAPAIVLASALVDYARARSNATAIARARSTMYRNALDVVGGDPRAHDEARARSNGSPATSRMRNFFDF